MTEFDSLENAIGATSAARPGRPSTLVTRLTGQVSSLATSLAPRVGPGRRRQGGRRTALAHELQLELESIRGYSQFLTKNPDMPHDHRRKCLEKVLSSCESADRVLTALMLYSPGERWNKAA